MGRVAAPVSQPILFVTVSLGAKAYKGSSLVCKEGGTAALHITLVPPPFIPPPLLALSLYFLLILFFPLSEGVEFGMHGTLLSV